ncbi:hypothetical protein EBH_0007170 [Eimeria brunetti]|uniref:Uncharacterized protein n=1 Tax=Eimeria brunetti TaxID=51314 RepID=U6LT76_9EIME|nr:hypothetical protein EBH_0007170 [Eimeria brunetti]
MFDRLLSHLVRKQSAGITGGRGLGAQLVLENVDPSAGRIKERAVPLEWQQRFTENRLILQMAVCSTQTSLDQLEMPVYGHMATLMGGPSSWVNRHSVQECTTAGGAFFCLTGIQKLPPVIGDVYNSPSADAMMGFVGFSCCKLRRITSLVAGLALVLLSSLQEKMLECYDLTT